MCGASLQILTMQRAKTLKLKSFEFEGTKLSIRPTFTVFITVGLRLVLHIQICAGLLCM